MIWANVTKFGQNFIAPPKFFWDGTAMDIIINVPRYSVVDIG